MLAGYPGTGRKTAVKNFVRAQAKVQPVPPDWCYVNNAITYPKALAEGEFLQDMNFMSCRNARFL